MNKKHKDSFDELFKLIYKDHADAISISHKLIEISHTWDDLVDGDPVCPKDINSAFIGSIFEVQHNPLWFKCGLNHHVLNCYLRWRDATSIEESKDKTVDDLNKCYMLRAGVYDIFVVIAYFLHGNDWAEKIGPVVRKHYGEKLKDYLQEVMDA